MADKNLLRWVCKWDLWIQNLPDLLRDIPGSLGDADPFVQTAFNLKNLHRLRRELEEAVRRRAQPLHCAMLGRVNRLLGLPFETLLNAALKDKTARLWAELWKAEASMKSNPDSALALLAGHKGATAAAYRTVILMLKKQWTQACREIEPVLHKETGHPLFQLFLGVSLAQKGKREQALVHYDSAIRGGLDGAVPHWLKAYVYKSLGRKKELYSEVREALFRSPECGFFNRMMEGAWPPNPEEGPNTEERLVLLRRAVQKSPFPTWALAFRSTIYRRPLFSMYKEAAADLGRAARLEPGSAWIQAHLARALEGIGKQKEGWKSLERAARMEPACGWIRAWRGAWLLRKRDPAALKELDLAVKLSPSYAHAHAWHGGALLFQGRALEASRELEIAVYLEPDYVWSQAQLFQAYQNLGQWGKAARMFARVYQRNYKYAQFYSEAKNLGELGNSLDAAIQADPSDEWLRLWRAWVHMRTGSSQKALEVLRNVTGCRNAFFYQVKSEAQEKMGLPLQAFQSISRAVKLCPQSPLLKAERGALACNIGRWRAAVSDLLCSVKNENLGAPFFSKLGHSLMELRRFRQAEHYLNLSLAFNPQYVEARILRLLVRFRLGEKSRPGRDLNAVKKIQPDSPWIHWAQAQMSGYPEGTYASLKKVLTATRLTFPPVLFARAKKQAGRLLGKCEEKKLLWIVRRWSRQGDHAAALSLCRDILKINPGGVSAHRLCAEALCCLGRPEEAAAVLDRLVRITHHHPDSVLRRGAVRRQAGDFLGALQDAETILSRRPRHVQALILQSESLRNMGRLKEAESQASRAIEADSGYSWAYVVRLKARRQMGKLSAALEDANQAIRVNSGDAKAYAWRADVLRKQKKFKDALSSAAQAVKLDPQCAWARALRAEIYRDLEVPGRCLEDLGETMRIDPRCSCAYDILGNCPGPVKKDAGYAWVYAWRGGVLRARGNLEAALKDFNQAIYLDPFCFWARAWRGELFLVAGQMRRALDDLNTALVQFPGYTQARIWQGRALMGLHKPAEALRCFSAILKTDPENFFALAGRAACLHALDRSDILSRERIPLSRIKNVSAMGAS